MVLPRDADGECNASAVARSARPVPVAEGARAASPTGAGSAFCLLAWNRSVGWSSGDGDDPRHRVMGAQAAVDLIGNNAIGPRLGLAGLAAGTPYGRCQCGMLRLHSSVPLCR